MYCMVCCKFGKDGLSGVCGSPAEFYLPDLTVGRFCQAGGWCIPKQFRPDTAGHLLAPFGFLHVM